MHVSWFSLFLSVSLWLSSPLAYSQAIVDPGFEKADASSWQPIVEEGGVVSVDALIKRSGNSSARLQASSLKSRTVMRQVIKGVSAGSPMNAIAYVRTAGADKGAFLEIICLDAKGKKLSSFQSSIVKGTTFEETWEKLSVGFKVPENGGFIRIQLVLEGKGTAWFDDVQLSGADVEGAASRKSAKEDQFTQLVIDESFDGPLSPETWLPMTDEAEIKDGSVKIPPGGLLRTRLVYPEGMVEFRLKFTADASFLGFGYRQKYGGSQHIGFTTTSSHTGLVPVVQDLKGKRTSTDPVVTDGESHLYRIVWETDRVRFLVDGVEKSSLSLTDHRLEPTAISVYNQATDADVIVESIKVYISEADQKGLKELQGKNRYSFVEVPFTETEPRPVPSQEDTKQGAILFQRNYMEHLFANAHPRKSERVDALQVRACPGEAQPVLLGVYALEDYRVDAVKVSEARSPQGSVIPADALSLGVIKSIPKRHLYFHGWTLSYTKMPMLIEPMASFKIAKDASQGVWIDCSVPPNTSAGVYRAMVVMETSKGPVQIPLDITVYPFTLVKADKMFYGAFETVFQTLGSAGAKRRERIKEVLTEMSRNGMTTVGFTSHWAKVSGDITSPEVTMTSLYGEFAEVYQELGFQQPLVQLHDPAFDFTMRTPGDESRKDAYGSVASLVHREAMEKTGLDYYLQPIDEPSYQKPEMKTLALRALKAMKAAGLKSAQDGPLDNFMLEDVLPVTDMLLFNGAIPADAYLKKAKERGAKVLIYNTDVETWRPVVDRYTAGFFQHKYGLDGVIQWEYQAQPNVVTTYYEIEPDLAWAYMAYYYPRLKGHPGGPTIAWKALRGGIFDYRYVLTLQEEIRRVRPTNPKLAAEADLVLIKLFSSLNDLRQLRQTAQWSGTQGDAKAKSISGIYNLKNGWSLDDYDRARAEIASWIMRLQGLTP